MSRLVQCAAISAAVLLCVSNPSWADKMSELKDIHNKLVQAQRTLNSQMMCDLFHEKVTRLTAPSMFPILGKKAACRALSSAMQTFEAFRITLYEPKYTVVDSTGVVMAHYRVAIRRKGGGVITSQGHQSTTYVHTNGGWQMLAYHVKPFQITN